MPLSPSFSTNTQARIALTMIRQAGVPAPADAVDQLETFIAEGIDVLTHTAGYDPTDYAVTQAGVALRDYAIWQFLSIGPNTLPLAARAQQQYELNLQKWSEQAAKEYWYEYLISREE